MPNLRLRLTANEDTANALINAVSGLEGVHSAEEVADLMAHAYDDDSSSAGLPDDAGPGSHVIEIETSNQTISRRVTEIAEALAHDRGAGLEFVDNE